MRLLLGFYVLIIAAAVLYHAGWHAFWMFPPTLVLSFVGGLALALVTRGLFGGDDANGT